MQKKAKEPPGNNRRTPGVHSSILTSLGLPRFQCPVCKKGVSGIWLLEDQIRGYMWGCPSFRGELHSHGVKCCSDTLKKGVSPAHCLDKSDFTFSSVHRAVLLLPGPGEL